MSNISELPFTISLADESQANISPKVYSSDSHISYIMDSLMGIMLNPSPIEKLEPVDKLKKFDQMCMDARISAALDERYYSVMSMDFLVSYPDGVNENEDVTAFINNNIIDTSLFQEIVRNIMAFLKYGASYCWPTINQTTYMLERLDLLPTPKMIWRDNGEIAIKTRKEPVKGEVLDQNILLTTMRGRPFYGTSILEPVYWLWYMKKIFVKNWGIFGSEAASGNTFFKLADGVSLDPKRNKDAQLLLDLKKIGDNAKAIVPPQVEDIIRLAGNSSGVGSFFKDGVQYWDSEITKAIAGQTAGSSDATGGLGGQQVGQVMTKREIAIADSKYVQGSLNRLLRLVLPFHFTIPDEQYPNIVLIPKAEYDKEQKLKEFDLLLTKGVSLSNKQVREVFGWTEPEDEADTITGKTTETPAPNPFTGFSDGKGKTEVIKFANERESFLRRKDRDAIKKDEFITSILQKTADDQIRIYKPIVDYYKNEATKIIGNSEGVLSEKKADKLKNIKLPSSIQNRLNSFYSTALVVYWAAGYDRMQKAAAEVVTTKLANGLYETDVFDVVPDIDLVEMFNAIEMLDGSIPRLNITAIKDRLSKAASIGGLRIGEDSTGTLTNFWEKQIIGALEKGQTYKEFEKSIPAILESSGITGVRPYHIETIFRTNMSDAFNSGEYAAINEDEIVKSAFPYARYSAVGDDRTRPAHMAMDGAILRVDSAEFNAWYPPNGYNCRCVFEYITEFEAEEYGITESNISERQAIDKKGREVPLSPDTGFVGLSEMARLG